ncbi:MAG: bifunctional nuclease family protein [Candidatus Obscuribacterales bacterium]|nr:bifunctional nuclease family protein [Candidatus Obscuribacterales bacterium]
MSLIEMKIASVGVDPRGGHLVLLQDGAMKKALPIWIGMSEARAIAMAIQGKSPPRPLTHQLILSIIERFQYKVKHIIVDELKESTFTAKIVLEPAVIEPKEQKGNLDARPMLEIDCRPSDAIAIATIEGTPLLVSKEVLTAAAVNIDLESRIKESDDFKKFLSTIKASDFKLDSPIELPPEEEEEEEDN